MDDFVIAMLQTAEGNRLGYPFKRTKDGNPKDVYFAPNVSQALKDHVLNHPSTRNRLFLESGSDCAPQQE